MMITSPSPLISIIIATRDRPHFAALGLEGLKKQSFRDFEVIVSDNALRRPFVPNPELFDGIRFRYVRPPRPVWMADHWEFAVTLARGRYVGVLGDKSVLVPSALERVAAEINSASPDAVSWGTAGFTAPPDNLGGRGVLSLMGSMGAKGIAVSPAESLEYLLATYLEPNFRADHQLEIRGSIYHGVFSAALLANMKSRFGKIFRFYAPDLNAQCAAMQTARHVTHIPRPLEVVVAGPSNGVAVGMSAAHLLNTQAEAAVAGSSPPLIPGVSASISHLLASDLVAISGRALGAAQWTELYRRTAFELYRAGDWPDASMQRNQVHALLASARSFDPDLSRRLARENWNAARAKARGFLSMQLRKHLGPRVDGLRRILLGPDPFIKKRSFESLVAALEAIS